MITIYCIEEQYPDEKATNINQVELPIKTGWEYFNRWPLLHEYDNEKEFKNDLIHMLERNTVISKVYCRQETDDYKPLMKLL